MSDPDLDLGKPWFIAFDGTYSGEPMLVLDDGWVEIGYTTEGPAKTESEELH